MGTGPDGVSVELFDEKQRPRIGMSVGRKSGPVMSITNADGSEDIALLISNAQPVIRLGTNDGGFVELSAAELAKAIKTAPEVRKR